MNKSDGELFLEKNAYRKELPWDVIFSINDVLETCNKLRHKISVLNRRLQRVRTENKRLQKRNEKLEELLLDYVACQIPD